MKFQEIVEKLKVGEKYTLVAFSEFGFPFSFKFRLCEVDVKPYAQYEEALLIIGLKKGARKYATRFRFLPYQEFLIYEGWVDVNTEMYVEELPSDNPGVISVRRSLHAFDKKYLEISRNSVNKAPLVDYRGQ